MPSVQNTERLAEIKEDLTDIQAMWVVDYRGLTVKQSEQLRNSIREAGAIMKVHKNKLVRLAHRQASRQSSEPYGQNRTRAQRPNGGICTLRICYRRSEGCSLKALQPMKDIIQAA